MNRQLPRRAVPSALVLGLLAASLPACSDGSRGPLAVEPAVAAPASAGGAASTSPAADSLVLADFEADGSAGWSTFSGSDSRVDLRLVSPGAAGGRALRVSYSVASYGSAQREHATPQDWSGYGSFDFHLFGRKTGNTIRVEVKDNGASTSRAEIFEYRIRDDFRGWKAFRLPWSDFSRRADWQPEGAPDDGFGRTGVWGYRFTPLGGSGYFQVDQVKLSGPEPVALPAPDPAPAACSASDHLRRVPVATAAELSRALAEARPGDLVALEDGVYTGRFETAASGTAEARIRLCGSRAAVIRTGRIHDYGYAVTIRGSYWTVEGITITDSQQGIKTFGGHHNVLTGLLVHGIGQEAVKFHGNSTRNRLERSEIRNTGLSVAEYGEGVYLGSWWGHWGEYSGGRPDASDHNEVVDNVFGPDVRAEHVDAKEGTTGGIIRGNTFVGAGMVRSKEWVDSWVELKGNGYLVEANRGVGSPNDGFQAFVERDGWGNGNVFRGNTADLAGASGYGIRVSAPAADNVVACDNRVLNAPAGMANVGCR